MGNAVELLRTTVTPEPRLSEETEIPLTESRKELLIRCSEWIRNDQYVKWLKNEVKFIGGHDLESENSKKLRATEISVEEEQALATLLKQVLKSQQNIEAIIDKALPEVKNDSMPRNIDEDWLNYFFDKGRLISNPHIQKLWGKVLADKANFPNLYSKNLIDSLQRMETQDIENLQSLCNFSVTRDFLLPIIFNIKDEIYTNTGLNFSALKNLQSLGLIILDEHNALKLTEQQHIITLYYFDYRFVIKFPNKNSLTNKVGAVLLTELGGQLAKLCSPKFIDGFPDYLTQKWRSCGYEVIVTQK